jgi:predicted enzyme related to lactoylglutathione lyase
MRSALRLNQARVGNHNKETAVTNAFGSSRDVIISTDAWAEATRFYGTVLGLPVTHRSETLMGFETGAFCLYVEKGRRHGPVFEFLVADVQAEKTRLIAAGCTVVEEDASIPRCYIRDPYGIVFNLRRAATEK